MNNLYDLVSGDLVVARLGRHVRDPLPPPVVFPVLAVASPHGFSGCMQITAAAAAPVSRGVYSNSSGCIGGNLTTRRPCSAKVFGRDPNVWKPSAHACTVINKWLGKPDPTPTVRESSGVIRFHTIVRRNCGKKKNISKTFVSASKINSTRRTMPLSL